MKLNIDGLLKSIDSLAPIPAITHRIMEIANAPDGSLAELADIIKYDADITSNLLKICNSAYFSLPVTVESVRQAVTLLGSNTILELVLMASTGQNMMKAQKGYGLARGELWKHSVATAMASKSIADTKEILDKYRIYTASLIKDIGKVIIENHVGKSIKKIIHLVRKKNYSFDQAEEETLGVNHAAIGGMIAEKWNFSPQMVFMIANHHLNSEASKQNVETSIIYLTDTISRMVGIGIGADGLAYKMYDVVFDNLGVSRQDIEHIMGEIKIGLYRAERLLHSF
jgi:HD-like signal output (HDOD) protein